MQPQRGSNIFQVPLTFDYRGGSSSSTKHKILWSLLVLLVDVFLSVVLFLSNTVLSALIWSLVVLFLSTYVLRFVIFRENYFRGKRKELLENNYLFDNTSFWNIYEISSREPHIVKFGTGMRGVFIAFDKDVIVGKDPDNSFDHMESLAEAYKNMQRKGIDCIHIDYMDVVGKDDRMTSLFDLASGVDNEELKMVVTMMYDYTVKSMNLVYASYDVYCFYSYSREDIFWSELQQVIQFFLQANYIRARMLNREAISALTETLLNLDDFSVNNANNSRLMQINNDSNFIRQIWVEKNGVREVLSKTMEEMEEDKRVLQAEKSVKRKSKSKSKDSIDLFSTHENTGLDPLQGYEYTASNGNNQSKDDEDEIEI